VSRVVGSLAVNGEWRHGVTGCLGSRVGAGAVRDPHGPRVEAGGLAGFRAHLAESVGQVFREGIRGEGVEKASRLGQVGPEAEGPPDPHTDDYDRPVSPGIALGRPVRVLPGPSQSGPGVTSVLRPSRSPSVNSGGTS
jgi:hypothetical protein